MTAPRILAAVEHEVAALRRALAEDIEQIATLAACTAQERTTDEALRELPAVIARAVRVAAEDNATIDAENAEEMRERLAAQEAVL